MFMYFWLNYCDENHIERIPIARSSHWKCSVKIGVLRNVAKFTGKHMCFFAGLSLQLY